MQGEHKLNNDELFSDERLIEIIDSQDRNLIDVYTMGDDPLTSLDFRKGDLGDLSGSEILGAVKSGKLWVNLREFERATPRTRAIFEDFEADLKEITPDFRRGSQKMKLLISSPNAHVAYHADTKDQFLIQLRGQKRVWLYPNTPPFVRPSEIEGIVLGETSEEMTYDPVYDDDAEQVLLTPGSYVTWPQYAPHRIVNEDCLNVSLTCEYLTTTSQVRTGAVYFNGVTRRKFGLNGQTPGAVSPATYAKWALGRLLRQTPASNIAQNRDQVVFDVDLSAPRCVRDFAPAE